MKKIIFTFLLSYISIITFGQSITFSPTSTDKQLIKSYGSVGSSITGLRAKGTFTTPTAVVAGDNLLTLSGGGYNGVYFSTDAAGILFDANQTFTPTAKGANIRFSTTANNTNFVSERMRIAHDGKVGIGTTAPETKLDVFGDIALSSFAFGGSSVGTYHNWNVSGVSHLIVKTTGQIYTGFAGGKEGKLLFIFSSFGDFTLNTLDSNSLPENQIRASSNLPSSISVKGAILIYTGYHDMWSIVSTF